MSLDESQNLGGESGITCVEADRRVEVIATLHLPIAAIDLPGILKSSAWPSRRHPKFRGALLPDSVGKIASAPHGLALFTGPPAPASRQRRRASSMPSTRSGRAT
jgi:hypothetical protein